MSKIQLRAMAKINLFLDVLGVRKDGYHLVKMVMQSVGLFDVINIEVKKGREISLCVSKELKCDTRANTAYIAAREFMKETGVSGVGIDIKIEKNIPSGAGLAGGSADAAAVIVGLNRLFKTELEESALLKIGERVGSDVPFCIIGGTCLAEGTGTTLTKIGNMPDCFILIAKPDENVSTKEAYSQMNNLKTAGDNNFCRMIDGINNMTLSKIGENLFNRFEGVLRLPDVEKIKKIMCRHGSVGALMTGSGSAVFGLFTGKEEALGCEQLLKKEYREVFLCNNKGVSYEIIK